MIDAYTFMTPNGEKLMIALEELALPYRTHWVHIGKSEQHRPEFLAINPNAKIPAIVDHDGPDGKPITLFESSAILEYLADKTGKLLPRTGAARYTALQWMAFQLANVGPMTGQLGHFAKYAKDKIPYAIERYLKETNRIHDVLDQRLGEARYLGGDEYTMADIMTISWVLAPTEHYKVESLAVTSARPNLKRWVDEILARPAVQRARALTAPSTKAA